MDAFIRWYTVYMGQSTTLHASQQTDDLSRVMFIFQLLQSGLIFTALVAGAISIEVTITELKILSNKECNVSVFNYAE
ncbi:hypothetical protein MAR_002195 [Mya arenaria]|uniref:Uncharacterized protein n=1 Tax=Mya arenaria TaxID=6604 RepID=A0ABY7FFJ0_MYAAR|nr:hypothetical protein MAR_002195 [Mya arenaria]